ncbi:MAG: hypothetical protein LUF81_02340 [Clostridiales bacterium]|nr:hypothetical protein [Clostridiales bacterium]
MLFPLFLCLFDDFMNRKLLHSSFLLCLAGMLWINVCVVGNDQLAMREGRTAVVTIAENIVTRLADEGYINAETDTTIAIVGRPAENVMFAQTTAWKQANKYAQFGGAYWYADAGNNRRSWNGLLVGYCGIQLNFCSDDTFKELIATSTIAEMPCFPDEGSICEVDGIVVIKVSDYY